MTLPQNSRPHQAPPYLAENPMLAAIFNSDLLAIAVVDSHGKFVSINEGFCKLFGIERTSYLEKPFKSLFSSFTEEECASIINNKQLSNNSTPNTGLLLAFSPAKGSAAKIKITSDKISFGQTSGSFIVAQDISAEISNAETKVKAQNLHDALINNSKDLIWSLDRNFNLTAANTAFLQSMETDHGISCRIGDQMLRADVFSPEVLEIWRSSYQFVLDGGEIQREVYVSQTPRKAECWIDVSFNPIYSGEIIEGIACSSRDITERKLAEKRLVESELRLAEAQEVAKMGNWETDILSLSVIWSAETYRIFDIIPGSQEVYHDDFLNFIHPQDLQRVSDAFTLSLSGQNTESIEHRIVTAKGETKDLEQRWRIYRDNNGMPTRAVGTCQDITVRKTAERRMQESEILYRSLIEQATDTVCITDQSFCFLEINPSGCAAFGYTKEELLGMHVSEVLFKEDIANNPLRLSDLKAGKTVENERRIKCKDGSPIFVELTGKALPDGKIMFYGRDITGRRAAEQYLKESNERYNLISNATNDMVWDWDLVSGKIYRNKEGWKKIFKCRPDKVLNDDIMDWNERIHPDDYDTIATVSNEILNKANDSFEVECRVLRDDGKYAYVHDKGHIIRDEYGNATRIIGATQDVTASKEAGLKLEKSEARFRLLVQNSSDLVSIVNARGYYTYCSLAITIILGYEPAFMIGKNAFSFIHPDDATAIKKQMKEAQHEQKPFELKPFRYINKNGDWRWLESRVTDMSANPDLAGFVFNSRDVTDRVIAAEEIKKLSLVARETTNAVIITDPFGKVVWVNEAFTRMTEFEPLDVIGKKPGDCLQGPNTSPATVRYMHQKIEKQLPFECDIINYTRSGKEYWLRVQCQPQFDLEGNLEAFFAIQTDITSEKETELILKSSEENYRYLFNNNPSSIIVWDLETLQVLEVNETAEKLYGYSYKEFVTTSILDLRDTEDHVQIKSFAAQALTSKEFKEMHTWKHYSKRGEVMYMRISSNKIVYNNRPVIFSMGTNVTDKLVLEKMLEQERLERQKEITKAVISAQENERHELGRELHDNINQILASSLLYLGLAKTNISKEPTFINKADELVQSAIVEVRNLSHSLIPPSLNDSELLEALSRVMDTARLSGKLQIELEAPGFDETKVPDNLKLTVFRIVQEQLNNILKHAGATFVKVSVLLKPNDLQLIIVDNGNGFNISKKHSGVGLMNIKTRVALFEGKLRINSSPGDGCELTVTFSLTPAK